jgi:hypothetical protein
MPAVGSSRSTPAAAPLLPVFEKYSMNFCSASGDLL